MNTSRMTAILVGTLFIIGTVAGILSVVVTAPLSEAPDLLTRVAANEDRVALGALLVLIMGFALAIVPVLMFPIAKRHNETLALGYVVFRGGLETVTYFGWAISWLLLVPLSQAYVQAGASDASTIQALGALLLKAGATSGMLTAIVFPLGALMFYALLYQSKLIPRWISVWGGIGVTLHLAGTGLAGMFGLTDLPMIVQLVVVLPILIQEMVMAVWLIAKGFCPAALVSGSTKAEPYDAQMSAATLSTTG
jgi:Domain of unknown function (DUF4386)